jgi:alpha-tubulin suppressor-like RCC1 family protein
VNVLALASPLRVLTLVGSSRLSVDGSPNPLSLAGNCRVRAVACGQAHTLAITDSGDLWVWGCGMHGGEECVRVYVFAYIHEQTHCTRTHAHTNLHCTLHAHTSVLGLNSDKDLFVPCLMSASHFGGAKVMHSRAWIG